MRLCGMANTGIHVRHWSTAAASAAAAMTASNMALKTSYPVMQLVKFREVVSVLRLQSLQYRQS